MNSGQKTHCANFHFRVGFVILLQVSRTDSFSEEAFSCPDDREISLDEFLKRRTVMYLSSSPKTLL